MEREIAPWQEGFKVDPVKEEVQSERAAELIKLQAQVEEKFQKFAADCRWHVGAVPAGHSEPTIEICMCPMQRCGACNLFNCPIV